MPKAGGRKISRKHSTVIDAAKPIVAMLTKRPEVRSITLGQIVPGLKSGQARRIKVSPATGGLKVQVRGSSSIQILWVYTSATNLTTKALEDF